jgi:hypothetical protein
VAVQYPRRDLSPAALPRVLVYATALTCGVLAAMALQIYLDRAGFDLVGLWHNLFSAKALQLRTAGPWWGSAGIAFLVGGAVAAVLSRAPLPWRRWRLVRWVAGALVVFALARVGEATVGPADVGAGANVAASLGALGLAALMSVVGAYFTVPR